MKNNYIAIIAAEDKEVLAVKEKMTEINEDKIYNITANLLEISCKICYYVFNNFCEEILC